MRKSTPLVMMFVFITMTAVGKPNKPSKAVVPEFTDTLPGSSRPILLWIFE